MSDGHDTARMWEDDAASRMLGMRLLEQGDGTARVSMVVRDDLVNGYGILHGGLMAALADSAFALACNSRGTVTIASGFDVTFLEPGRLGDELIADAREVALRGRSGVYDVTVRRVAGPANDGSGNDGSGNDGSGNDGTVLAEFRGRSRALR